ncbi:MAG: hypothetical protein KFF73_06675 [Cyclobacteriaceae bacterium]|nr:hypothetical protein [Cyclobacteriaceae bacterium]
MKPRRYNGYLVCAVAYLVFITSVWARPNEEKRKTIEKSYAVSDATEMNISNSFGKVHVETWDKKQVTVKIDIIVNASTESRAQEFLDKITVNINDSDPRSELSFNTSIDGKNAGRNTSFEVNYTVSMPRNNPLDLKNSFGDVYVGPLGGSVKLDVQYGNLNTGALSGNAEVKLAFGSGFSSIESFKKGELRLSYSKLNVSEIGVAEVNSQFSTLEIDKAGTLELTGKYGEIEIGEIESLEADVNFSGFEIEKVLKDIELDIDYGGHISIGLAGTVKKVDIQSSFGPLVLEIPSGMNANFEANLSFSDLNYDESRISFSKVIKEHTSSEYVGKIGSGGEASIIITSKYGSVRLR